MFGWFFFWIGHFFGKKIVAHPKIPIDETHIMETQKFFHTHGGKTIILARFMPFIRTFAPFVAGISRMKYDRFLFYNVIGGLLWVAIGVFAGYFFGNLKFIRENFSLVIIGIIIISLIPIAVEIIRKKLKGKSQDSKVKVKS